MTMELTNQNGAHPGGLGAYRQLSTIESITAPPRNPAKQTLEFAYSSYGAEQIQAIEIAHSTPLFGGVRTNVLPFKRHATGRSGSPKSIAEQLGSAQAMVDRLRKVADKAKRVSRHDL